MPEQSSAHFYLNWAKERIDEMDATLASLEAKASQLQADAKSRAGQLIADLQKRRDEFQAAVKKQVEAGQAAWERTKTQLESQWNGFEAQVKAYFETVGKQVQQQQATFQDVAAAQVKAWREAADKLHTEAAIRFGNYAWRWAMEGGKTQCCIEPLPQDRRFVGLDWQRWPYSILYQAFLHNQQWWHNATTGVRRVAQRHEDMVEFAARQILDVLSPSNFLLTNPEVLRQTLSTVSYTHLTLPTKA